MFARRLSCLIVIGTISLCATRLQASDLTFYIGGIKPGSISYQNVRTSLDSSPVLGFRLGTNFVPFFGMEHTLAFSWDYLFPQNLGCQGGERI